MRHHHEGSRFCFWLLAFIGLTRERASKLTSYWPVDYLGHVLKQDDINAHAPQIAIQLQYHVRAVYIISALYSLL